MRLQILVLFACALAPAVHGQFIIADQQYRCPPSDAVCNATGKPTAFEHLTSAKNHYPFTINYVEYNDKGMAWSPRELTDTIEQLKAAIDDGNLHPIVVVYAHGWQNNASEAPNNDVHKFRTFLSGLADDYPPPASGKVPNVIGVYLAWRGESFTVEPFKHIVSYWPRRHFAKKMGQTGIAAAVNKIAQTINANPTVRENTILVFAGHSFGARVMENAIDGIDKQGKPGILKDYFDNTHQIAQKVSAANGVVTQQDLHNLPRLPVDLVVYVNAATSSAKTRGRVKQIEQDCKEHSFEICKADPLYVAFTSTNDLATGLVMPIANAVFPDLISDHLDLISAANSPWMHTHRAPELGCPPGEAICFDIVGTTTSQYYLPRIPNKLQVPPANPFWIFNVHKNLVDGHGDVWNDNVLNLVTAILKNNGHYLQVRGLAEKAVEQPR